MSEKFRLLTISGFLLIPQVRFRFRHGESPTFRHPPRRKKRGRHQELLLRNVRDVHQMADESVLRRQHAHQVFGLRAEGAIVRTKIPHRLIDEQSDADAFKGHLRLRLVFARHRRFVPLLRLGAFTRRRHPIYAAKVLGRRISHLPSVVILPLSLRAISGPRVVKNASDSRRAPSG